VNAFATGKTEIEDRERGRQRRQEATVLEGIERERVIDWMGKGKEGRVREATQVCATRAACI